MEVERKCEMALTKQKRKKMEDMIIDVYEIMDKQGANLQQFKNMFKSMSDSQFDAYFKKFLNDPKQNFSIEIEPFSDSGTLSLKDIEQAAEYLDVKLNEYVYMPFVNDDKDNPTRSNTRVPVGYIHAKRLQQILSKKNTMSHEISSRNQKTG